MEAQFEIAYDRYIQYNTPYTCGTSGTDTGDLQVTIRRGVPRIFGGGGGVPRSVKEANKPNKRATGLKPRTCAPIRGQCLGPTSVCFVESSIFTALV